MERKAGSSALTSQKDTIGSSNLQKLLEARKDLKTELKSDFGGVQMLLHDRLGIKIPASLIGLLDLASLKWGREGHNFDSPSDLIVGAPASAGRFIDIQQATATIEIAAEKIFNEKEGKDEAVPICTRIAGVNKEHGRIVAVAYRYDLEAGNRLTELNISIPGDELLYVANSSYLNHFELSMFAIFPTAQAQAKNPYYTAGLITPFMCRASESIEMIVIQFKKDNSIVGKAEPYYYMDEKLMRAFDKLGYYLHKRGKNVRVGLNKIDAGKNNVDSWKISLPTFLPKS